MSNERQHRCGTARTSFQELTVSDAVKPCQVTARLCACEDVVGAERDWGRRDRHRVQRGSACLKLLQRLSKRRQDRRRNFFQKVFLRMRKYISAGTHVSGHRRLNSTHRWNAHSQPCQVTASPTSWQLSRQRLGPLSHVVSYRGWVFRVPGRQNICESTWEN